MAPHLCPWWGGYFIDNRLRRWLHEPRAILAPYVRPGTTALDFGCGMGLFAIAMAQMVGEEGHVVAVDLQQQMLNVLVQRAIKAGVADRVRTHRCNVDSLGIRAQVEFALAFYSAHEVPDQQRLLRELASCLPANGRLLVVEPVGHVTAKRFAEMLALAADEGFQLEERPRVRFSRAALFCKA